MDIQPATDRRVDETTPTDPIDTAFATLDRGFRQAALDDAEGFDRINGFRRAVSRLAGRWKDGEPAHSPKAKGV